MPVLYYQPAPGDPTRTSVDDGRFKFEAYQPTDVTNPVLFRKLKDNPWFGEEIDKSRHGRWLSRRYIEDAQGRLVVSERLS